MVTAEAPTLEVCGTCAVADDLYIISDGYLCLSCIGAAVSIATDIWPGDVGYTREFQKVLIDG